MINALMANVLDDAETDENRPRWTNHPNFPGVRLSERVAAAETDGAFKTLVVRLERGALMVAHRHPNQVEQHFVLEGDGVLTLSGEDRRYRPGDLQVIPRNAEHSVRGGAGGMVLLALFSPANA